MGGLLKYVSPWSEISSVLFLLVFCLVCIKKKNNTANSYLIIGLNLEILVN